MKLTIYHNSRCSKSRKTLEILREAGHAPEIVAYLDSPPDGDTILRLAKLLKISVKDLLRPKEDEFRHATDLPPTDDDTALAAWLSQHPKVIERPIVVDEDRQRAVIGRPPENVLRLLNAE